MRRRARGGARVVGAEWVLRRAHVERAKEDEGREVRDVVDSEVAVHRHGGRVDLLDDALHPPHVALHEGRGGGRR